MSGSDHLRTLALVAQISLTSATREQAALLSRLWSSRAFFEGGDGHEVDRGRRHAGTSASIRCRCPRTSLPKVERTVGFTQAAFLPSFTRPALSHHPEGWLERARTKGGMLTGSFRDKGKWAQNFRHSQVRLRRPEEYQLEGFHRATR